jgi:dipeptidyl aminopeptidase/acylaminoacyl peptidase
MKRQLALRAIYLTLAVLLALMAGSSAFAQTGARCFTETGFCINAEFRSYWEQNGELPVFGLPLTESRRERSRDDGSDYSTQWFERNRFEFHYANLNNASDNRQIVLLGRLGDDRLLQQGRDWQAFPKADPGVPNYFAETGHAITPQFIDYWRSHGLEQGDPGVSFGESLALFGYPLSEAQTEEVEPGVVVLTQWFERARFEYHPANPAPYQVLLGRLGAEIRATAMQQAQGGTLLFTGFRTQVAPDSNSTGLYTINGDGSGLTWLRVEQQLGPNESAYDYNWSPNSQQIAFVASEDYGQSSRVFVANRDGSGLRQIATGASELTWSPDGRRLAYLAYQDSQSDIYTVDLQSGERLRLTNTPETKREIAWSPDGNQIVFTFGPMELERPETHLGLVPSSGGSITQLLALAREPSWSPDGKRLAFTDISEDMLRVAVLDMASGTVQRLGEGNRPVWGPPAAPGQIAFYGPQNGPYSFPVQIANSDGSGLATVGSAYSGLSWSPDGKQLAVLVDIRIGYEVVILTIDGSAPPRALAYGGGAIYAP